MKIAIVTYDAPHLKTEQVALNLSARGVFDLHFFALPFRLRPSREPLFQHRPDQSSGAPTSEVAGLVGSSFTKVGDPGEIPDNGLDYYVITGAGLLPRDFVERTRGRVINAHPGIIPTSRGLDSFKWSIIDGLPIGNTLHLIDEEADAGEILSIRPTPVFATDTLESLARRHYEHEIDLLSSFDLYLAKPQPFQPLENPGPARMRMPREQEARLSAAFDRYRREHASSAVP